MGFANLAGRIPHPRGTISNRLLALGVGLFLLLAASVVYGFHYRMAKKEARKQQQQTQAVASDAAQSNLQSEEGEVPVTSLVGAQNPATMASITVPFVNAAQTVAHPFPGPSTTDNTQAAQPAQTQPAPMYYAPPVDPEEEIRKQTIERRYARQQEPIEGSNATQEQRPTSNPVGDPAAAEMAQLNSLLHPALPSTGAGAPGVGRQSAQDEKRQFQEGGEGLGDDYLKTTRVPPLSPWVVQRGTVIPAALPHRLVSDLPGDLIAEVQRDVYDSPTQKYVMIPAGSRLVGEFNSSVSYGQNRVQVVWAAIYFPDGSFIDLDRMTSHAADGAVGLHDQTDNHWKRIIGGVALSSLLAAGLQVSQNGTNGSVLTYPSTGQQIAAAVGTQASELGQQITSRNLSIQPSLKVRPGEIFSVSVKRDMLFAGPYEALPSR